jgi:hypothetical protein
MSKFALVTPDELEKEQDRHSIQPGQRLPSRLVNFPFPAVRAVHPSNLQHVAMSLFFDLLPIRQLSRALSLLTLVKVRRWLILLLLVPPTPE